MSSNEIKILRRKLQKARENGKLQDISDCCCSLAAYLSDEEDHEEALKLYKESLSCCEKLTYKEGTALANRMIAEECINLGYFEEALKHVMVFLKYAKDEKNKVEEQRGFVLKGHVYFTQAEYLADMKPRESKRVEQLLEQSMEAYRKSFAICNSELTDINEKERLQMKARLLQNKSLVLSRQNKLEYAQAHLIRAIKICAKEKLNETEHICYLSLGDLYIKKGEPHKAVNVYNRAFELSHSTKRKQDSLAGKARAFISMEDFQQAKVILKKAYKLKGDDEIKKLIKHVAAVIKMENNLCSTPDTELNVRKELYKKLGDVYCSLKVYKSGIKSYLNMLGCVQKAGLNKNELIKCYSRLCKAFMIDKQYDKALFYSHQEIESLSKWAHDRVFKVYLRIAELHELNNSEFEEIQLAYVRAKNKVENHKYKIKCLKRLIDICQNFNKFELMKEYEKELNDIRNEDDFDSSCDSGNDVDSEASFDSENNSESSDTDIKDLISDSDVENEEYDRPRERCKRTKFTIKRNEKGETELHVAAIKGNYKKVKQLLDQGHPVNVRDTAGWSPLHEACNHGHVDIVNILLDFGANINDRGGPSCDGTTPLHDAAINGQLEVIETLVKRGASTLVLNDAGQTPLQCLLEWKKCSALDAEEDAVFQNILQSLKSPLDSEDIKRHIRANKSFLKKTGSKPNPKKESNSVMKNKELKSKRMSAVLEYKETIDLLRGKQKTNHLYSDESQSGNSDDDCFGTFKRKKKSARDEYKEVIDELRFRPKKILTESLEPKPKPALINENEYVDNCILDNDEEEELEDDVDETMKNLLEERIYTQPSKKMKASPSPSKKPCLEKEKKFKPWLNSIPLDLLEDSFEISVKEDDVPKSVMKSNSETKTCTPNPSVDITVRVFNHIMKVSVSESEIDKFQINWLIEEICKSYPEVKNTDNFVYIKAGGDIIKESDFLNRVVGKEVECVITKWKALPLNERYEKICTVTSHPDISSEVRAFGFKHNVDPQISDILKKSSKTRCLTLSNLKLSSLTLIPICKALKYESFIQSLNLSNNYFGDKGIELIVKIFEKCIIEELDISGCNITSTGVYYFSNALKSMNELSKNGLELLNLSSNPITCDAVAAIEDIMQQLPNLRTLNIDHCDLKTLLKTNNSTDLNIIQGNEFESPHRNTGTHS